MLNPSMQKLMSKVNNRYLLVNLAAQRARDIVIEAEAAGGPIPEKPVKLAIDDIAEDKIEYREGPKPEPVIAQSDVMAALEQGAAAADAEEAPAAEEAPESDDILAEEL